MATIQKRKNKNGTTSYRVMIRPNDGLPSTYKTWPTYQEAKDWAIQEEARRRQGIYFPEKQRQRHTLTELIERYVGEMAPSKPASGDDIIRVTSIGGKTKLANTPLIILRPTLLLNIAKSYWMNRAQMGKRGSPQPLIVTWPLFLLFCPMQLKNTEIRTVFVDLDGSPLEPVLKGPLHPHLVIESSPGRYHAYWIIKGLSLEDFTPIQKLLAERFNGDTKVCDLSRIMRLPGFYHHKEMPYLTKILLESGEQPISKERWVKEMQLVPQSPTIVFASEDLIVSRLKEYGLLIKKASHPPKCWVIRCPWSALHSTADNEAKYFELDQSTHPLWRFSLFPCAL